MVSGDIFRVHFIWERPQGCIIPRSHGFVPAAFIPLLMSLVYLAGGAPRAASSPSRSGLTSGVYLYCIYLSWVAFMLKLPMIIISRLPQSLFLPHANRLHVKRGAPEHRDSGALTGSPALTPGLVHGIATWHTSGG